MDGYGKFLAGLMAFCAAFGGHAAQARAAWPPLEDLLKRSGDRALGALDARAQLRVAAASRVGAGVPAIGNPYVELQATRGAPTRDVAFTLFAATPIEVSGQRGTRLEESEALVRWRASAEAEARARVAVEVILRYGAAGIAVERAAQFERACVDAASEVELYSARLAAGDATAVDRSLAEAELGRYTQALAEARLSLASARLDLEVLSGGALGEGRPASTDPPALRSKDAAAFEARALSNSPALRALAGEAKYWEASRRRATAEGFAPLGLIINTTRSDGGDMSVGGGLAWTFPMTQRNQGPMAIAEAARDRAEELRGASEPVAARQARGLFASLSMARDALAAVDAAALPAAERLVAAILAAAKAGKTEYLHVLQARRDLASARARRLDLAETAWHIYAQMAALTGELP